MLTGEHPFDGETVTEVLAAVVRAEPEWSQLPTSRSLEAIWGISRTRSSSSSNFRRKKASCGRVRLWRDVR
jgi:hypothetical protein